MEGDFGWEVTKLLYHTLCRALLRHLQIYRFSGGRLKHGKKLRDPDTLARSLAAHYISGKRKHPIPEHEEKNIRRVAQDVRNVVAVMRKEILAWHNEPKATRKPPTWGEFKEQLMDQYDTHAHPWMRYFSDWFRKMTVSSGRTPSLADLESWKAIDLRRAIVKGWLYIRFGVEYPQSEITRITRRQARNPARNQAR
jgi:hypothetical protein